MSVILVDGFDHYLAADAPLKGWTVGFSNMTTGRFLDSLGRGQAAVFGNAANLAWPRNAPVATTVGFALNTIGANAGRQFFRIRTAGAVNVCHLEVDATNHLQIYDATNTLIATGPTVLNFNVWYYIEVKVTLGVAGNVEVHLDGNSEIPLTVANVGVTAAAQLVFQELSTTLTMAIDDLYVTDTAAFLGDVRVFPIWPDGAGAHAAWTPNGAPANYQCVDETTADGDATYIASSNPGDLDSYTFSNIDGGATVYAVQTNHYARKDDAALRQIAPLIRQGGVDYIGTTQTMPSAYSIARQVYDLDPAGNPWTAANVNADEYGTKEVT